MHQSEPDNGGSLATVVLGACPRRLARKTEPVLRRDGHCRRSHLPAETTEMSKHSPR